MSEAGNSDWKNENGSQRRWAQPRAVGAPLSRGSGRNAADDPGTSRQLPPPGRPLGDSDLSGAAPGSASNVERVVHAFRSAMPFVQRLLPLLEGNVASAVVNVLSHAPKPAAQAPVDLAPVQNSIGELQVQQAELAVQVQEQNGSLQRVQDQLDMVREATDRNTLEQQELMEDLRAVGQKVNLIAVVALGLLAVSVVINVLLYLHIERVLP
ncbi:MAG: hypothetical protein ACLGPM_00975 [Acidobacteriota bacterium]